MKGKAIQEMFFDSVSLKQLMHEKVPVKLTGFFLSNPGARELTQRRLLTKLADFPLTAARLSHGSLDLSHAHTFDITTFTGINLRREKKLWRDFYFSEPLQTLPREIVNSVPVPFRCNSFLWFRARAWLAGTASRTPLHRDIPHNLILVTEGEKDVLLVSPAESTTVRPNKIFSKAPNFAQADIRREDNIPAFHTVLKAGELLYIPPFWWHDILNKTRVTSFNYWFAPFGPLSFLAWLSSTAKKIMGLYRYEWRKPRA